MTLSVPSISLDTAPEPGSPRPPDQASNSPSLRPLVVDSASLARAMNPEEGLSPLEKYLYALTFLERLHAALDASRKATGVNHIPVKEMQSTQDSLTVTILCYPLSVLKDSSHPPQLKLNLYVCTSDYRLVARLEYSGINLPSDTDVQIFERFFESHVCPLFNEMAVFTFVSICRIAYPPIFSSFAQIMLAQLDPQANYRWKSIYS
uniref:Uncharacterized protein n=1 Tax=Ditylenchus dipsaci TaxID=166011 RepID=A0A915E7A8_9BILA